MSQSKPNLCKLLQFCTLVSKRDISFGVVSLKGEISGDFLLPITLYLRSYLHYLYCACVMLILIMYLLWFENSLQDKMNFFNKRKRRGEGEVSTKNTQPSKKTQVVSLVKKVGQGLRDIKEALPG